VGVFCRVLVGKLFLVDLAGSERLKKSGIEQLPEPRTFSHFISHCNPELYSNPEVGANLFFTH
jgi:hypothetical protein